ncbi:MAG: hypothetical protein GXY44_16355 [Phycisphaerales bacterium]|nr:hypothetical protein [Phycisphaerales bacterium]
MSNSDQGVVEQWLASHQPARIAGFDLQPVAHPLLPDTPQRIVKGQAAVYFLKDQHDNIWLLKKFTLSRRPTDAYLEQVSKLLPGRASFFTCTQRRILCSDHLDYSYSNYRNHELSDWLTGTILMPKVPGSPWATIADALRENDLKMSLPERLRAALSLAECVQHLEDGGCSHRDLSPGNIFISEDQHVYPIDLDSLYHRELPWQTNTTIGTLGFIAPFTRGPTGNYDASLSWCPLADRFALAILITELLLVNDSSPPPQGDGSLFAQAQLEQPESEFVRTQIEALAGIHPECGILLWQVLHRQEFGRCPAPQHWRAVLRKALRAHHDRFLDQPSPDNQKTQISHSCSACGRLFNIDIARLTILNEQNKPVLCYSCFGVRHLQRRGRDERDRMEALCERCQAPLRFPRQQIQTLRTAGKPILCRSCLAKQMADWKAEQLAYRQARTKVICATCGQSFLMLKDKQQTLLAKGRPQLCRSCFVQQSPKHQRVVIS